MAVKAKEWLVKEGHLSEVTRGRISTANHLILQEAHGRGVVFSDWSPQRNAVMVTETVKDGEVTEEVSVHRIDGYQSNGEIAEIAPYRYNHDTHTAYENTPDGSRGRMRSLREICFTDGVSLVQCTCGTPKVVARNGQGYVPVTIVAERVKSRAGNIWDNPRK